GPTLRSTGFSFHAVEAHLGHRWPIVDRVEDRVIPTRALMTVQHPRRDNKDVSCRPFEPIPGHCGTAFAPKHVVDRCAVMPMAGRLGPGREELNLARES